MLSSEPAAPLLGASPDSRWRNVRLAVTVLAVSAGSSFQFGFATGSLNNLEQIVPQSFAAQGHPLALAEWSLVVAGFSAGGLIGSMLGAYVLCRYFSRKTVLLINNGFVVLSCLLMMTSSVWWLLALGRVLIGVASGVLTGVVPMYFAEIAPRSTRAIVGTAHQMGITIGILVAQVLTTPAFGLTGSVERWRLTFVAPLACAVLETVVLPFCPESPSYTFRTRGSQQALQSLAELHHSASIHQHMEMLRAETTLDERMQGLTVAQLFRAKDLRRQLAVGVVIQLSMQFSGIDAIFYYSTLMFRKAGVHNPQLATTALGLVNVVTTLVAIAAMHKVGRRTLLLSAWPAMCISYIVIAISFFGEEAFGLSAAAELACAVVAMSGVIVAFTVGPGCVAWFVVAEMFPVGARDAAMALGVGINWAANIVIALGFPLLHSLLGPGTCGVFAASTLVFGIFTWRFVPETKNKSVHDISNSFEKL